MQTLLDLQGVFPLLTGIITLVVALLHPRFRKFIARAYRKTLGKHEYETEKTLTLIVAHLERIERELYNNGGSSLKDVLNDLDAEIRKLQEIQRLRLETDGSCTFTTDSKGHVTWTSKGFLELVGRTAEQMKGSGWIISVCPVYRKEAMAEWEKVVEDEREYSESLIYYKRPHEATSFPKLVTIHRMKSRNNGTIGWLGVVRDYQGELRQKDLFKYEDIEVK